MDYHFCSRSRVSRLGLLFPGLPFRVVNPGSYVSFQKAILISIKRTVTAERARVDVTAKLSVIALSYLRLFHRRLLFTAAYAGLWNQLELL